MSTRIMCRHCGRPIVNEDGRWIDPEATGDDSIWRETCDAHDTFVAEHEPTLTEPVIARDADNGTLLSYFPNEAAALEWVATYCKDYAGTIEVVPTALLGSTSFGRVVVATVGEGVYAGNVDSVDEVIACALAEGWAGALIKRLADVAKDPAKESVTAVVVDDDGPFRVECPKCGSDEFAYEENVVERRSFGSQMGDAEGGSVTVVWTVGCGGDGDGDPGLVCDSCDTPVELPEGWEVEYG